MVKPVIHYYEDISSKWKKAVSGKTYVMDTITSEAKPELYIFLGIVANEAPKDHKGSWNSAGIKLQNVRDNSVKVVDADDRYGDYPILNKAMVEKLKIRAHDLAEELDKYNHILELIAYYAYL